MEITHYSDGTIGYEYDGCQFRFNPDQQLSEHFTLREMLRSRYAEERGILNVPQQEGIIEALRMLCQQVLEPLRKALERPVLISSGYRTECLNYCVGGVKNSQHVKGEAADIYCQNQADARTIYNYIEAHLPYDQLILEHRRQWGTWWVHVSYTTRKALRKQAFKQER
jgi:hypothetical protein